MDNIRIGMSRTELKALFGEPSDVSWKGDVLKYGDMEYHFLVEKGTSQLVLVYSEDAEGNPTTHLKERPVSEASTPPKQCLVYPITNLRKHPDADHLQIANAGPHQIVVGVHYDEGTLGIFLPDGAIIPDKLADEMWVKGKLAGKQKNRVKARAMRGVQTEGLFYGSRFFEDKDGTRQLVESASWNPVWKAGDDVTAEIGVTFKED
jgi:hypothetical protein